MRFRFIISSTVFFLALHSFVVAQNFGCYDTPTNNNRYVDYIRTSDDFRNEPSFDGFSIDTHKNGFCEEYYKTRPWYPKQPKMYGVVLNGKKQGKWVLYIKDSLKCIGNYANGLKEGIWRYGFFKSNGDTEIFWSGTFMHDTLNGIVKKYNISSKGKVSIEEKINYLNGLKNGMDIKFFSDGRVEKLMNYINGKKNGNEIEYSENSIKPSENYVDSNNYRVIAVHYYFNDTLIGASIDESNGVSIERYINGKKEGVCSYYSDKGKLEKTIDYSNGLLSGEYSKYYKNGQLAFTILCKNGLPYTSVCAYTQDGKSLSPGTLKDGNGVLKCYFLNGQLNSTYTYKNQCINGAFIVYSDSGKVRESGDLKSIIDSDAIYDEYGIEDFCFNSYACQNMIFISGHGMDNYPDLRDSYESIGKDTSFYFKCFLNKKFYSNGTLSEVFYTKNNLTIGVAKNYYDDGKLESEENYKILNKDGNKQSVKDGCCKYYFKSGVIKAVVYFDEGKESGCSKYYDEAGNLMRVHYVFKNGSQYNIFNGDTVNCIDKNGLKEGKWINIDEHYNSYVEQEDDDCNIKPVSIKYFKDGEPTGTWYEKQNFYRMDSTVLEWIDSIKANCRNYYSGKLEASGQILDEYTKVGDWKEYNIEGKKSYLEWEGDYKFTNDGYIYCKSGDWTHYKKNGKIKEIVLFKNGKLVDPKQNKKRKIPSVKK